jgi:hypothetical protein
MAGIGDFHHDAALDERSQAVAQYCARHVQVREEIVETPDSVERIAQYQQRPAFADDLECARQRAILPVVRARQHVASKPENCL